ncbi:hypothetical protein [Parapedobacter soli]|uniref:hypothetical protein n=1 Tax=Parapedobacter soli TaxID=416955 RepID=UPI0021C7BCB0|nr:hypothetical protein [Parapedobacter soli]
MGNAKKGRVAIIMLAGLAILGWQLFSTFGGTGLSDQEIRELKTDGVKGTAILTAIERTGTIVNSIHQYAFTFDINTDSTQAFSHTEKKLIDPIYLSSIQIGMVIPAYLSKDNEKVWIDWEDAGIKDAY